MKRPMPYSLCEDECPSKTIITIPQRKIQRCYTKRTKKSVLVRELMNQVKCNICKIKMFKEEFEHEFNIPQVELDNFLVLLSRLEEKYVENTDDKSPFLKLNLSFLKLNKYFLKKKMQNFLNLSVVIEHFDTCLFKGLKNGRIKTFKKLDEFINRSISPHFMFRRDPDADVVEYNHENIKSFYTLQRSQDIVLNQYLKLNKIM